MNAKKTKAAGDPMEICSLTDLVELTEIAARVKVGGSFRKSDNGDFCYRIGDVMFTPKREKKSGAIHWECRGLFKKGFGRTPESSLDHAVKFSREEIEGLEKQLTWYEAPAVDALEEEEDAGTMSEDAFWSLIESVKWEERCQEEGGIEQIKAQLLLSLHTVENVRSMRHRYDKVKRALYNLVNNGFEGDAMRNVVVDSLLSHIIGCGKEEYEKNLADPWRHIRANNSDPETFYDCIPQEEDMKHMKKG